MQSSRTQVVWAGVAVLCYLVAAATFLIVVIGAGVIGPGPGLAGLTAADYALLFASVGLFVVGGYAMHRVRRYTRPDRSSLPSQFQSGPELSRSNTDDPIDGFGDEPGDEQVRCSNCSTLNDAEYRFCENCSSELPR